MTVASLWKALDRAGCGKRVGAMELQDHLQLKTKTNPWNFNEMEKISRSIENHPTLAIDLSIWICEALTSSAMKQNHVVDPSLQLVYCRILKLLNLGIKLVVVIEGKRRIRHGINGNKNKNDNNNNNDDNDNEKAPGEDKFRKRRSGAPFWTACERCEEMLKLVGVIVVRAKAEGEALCALLNQRNIVDGVISNDGDCLLFGAKTIYTHLNIENLEKCNVTRYDASDIRAVVDDDDADEYDETRQKSKEGQDVVKLSRNDLIAFAILTGSDIAGDGLSKIGCRKAIRFIRKCQMDNPLKKSDGNCSPSLEQLISWEETTFCKDDAGKDAYSGPHCGCCGHQGTKTSHKKHGCEGCGTEPGEVCFQLSPGGRFRKSLRTKALEMRSNFDPSSTVRAYHEPNENQVPYFLVGKTARTLKMKSPQFEKLLQSSFIIRGHSLQESREFIKKSLSAYLARQELFGQMSGSTKEDKPTKLPKNHNRPVPIQVNKLLVRGGKPSCQVKWMVKATMSDSEGNPMDQYEFLTIEEECVIQKCYPKLIQSFQEEEQKLKLQGTAEQEKRRAFLVLLDASRAHEGLVQVDRRKKDPARKDHFDKDDVREPTCQQVKRRHAISDDVKNILVQMAKRKDSKKVVPKSKKVVPKNEGSVAPLTEIICTKTTNFHEIIPKQQHICKNDDTNMILGNIDGIELTSDDSSTIKTRSVTSHDIIDDKISTINSQKYFRGTLTPGHIHFLGSRSVPQGELRRCNSMKEKNPHTRMIISRSNEVPKKSLKLACSDRIERKNTRHDQYQRTYFRKEDLKSISKNLLSRVRKQGYDSNAASRIEHGRSEKLQERLFVERFDAKESMVGSCLPMTDQPYRAINSGQKSPSHSPMVKRRRDKVKGGNHTHFNEYLYEDREISTAEDILTTRHSLPKKIISSRQVYEVNDYADELKSVGLVRTYIDKHDGIVKAFADPFSSKLEMQFDEASEIRKFDSGELDPQHRSRHDEWDCIHEHLECIPTVRKNKSRVVNSGMGHHDKHDGSVKAFADPFSSKLEMQFDDDYELENIPSNSYHYDKSEGIPSYAQSSQHQANNVKYKRRRSVDRKACIYKNNEITSNSTMMEDPQHVDENSGYQMYHRRESTHRSMGNGCCCNESICGQSYMVQPNLLDKRRGLKENVSRISDPFSCLEYQDHRQDHCQDHRQDHHRQDHHRQDCWYSSADDEIRTDPEDLAYHSETSNNDFFSKDVIVSEEIEKRVATKLESFTRRAKIGLLCAKYIGDDNWGDY
jgi:flap endonuclease GEN